MESRIPLPTDNIFKFYALFGLLLVIFAVGASLYVTKSSNDAFTQSFVEIETLKELQNPSAGQTARRKVLERLMEVGAADKKTYGGMLLGIVVVGTLLMMYGFGQWHTKIQPLQDELLKLQVEKLRAEARVRFRRR